VDFVAVMDQVITLRQQGRLTYRPLQRQLTIDRLTRRIERLGYDGHLEPVAVPVVGEMFKATRLGHRNDAAFRQRKALLKPFGSTRYDTDSWSAYTLSSRCGRAPTGQVPHAAA